MRKILSTGLPRYKHTQRDIGKDFESIAYLEWCDFEKILLIDEIRMRA